MEENKDIMPEGQMQEETPQAGQSDREDTIYTMPDVYQTQMNNELYQTPDMDAGHRNEGGVFSGGQQNDTDGNIPQYGNDGYIGGQYPNAGGDIPGNQYQYQNVNNDMSGNQYQYQNVNNDMSGNQYQYQNANNDMPGNQYQYQNANNDMPGKQYQYGNNVTDQNQYQYGNNGAAGNQYQYQNVNNDMPGNQYQYGNNAAGQNQYQYGNSAAGQNQYQYGNNAAGQNQYQYGNNGAAGNQYQYGNSYGYNGPYSPYAVPQKKKNTGLIIGIIITVSVVILIAFVAIFYNAFKMLDNTVGAHSTLSGIDDDTDNIGNNDTDKDDRDNKDDEDNRDSRRDDDDKRRNDDDNNNDYDDGEYYSFHDDIKNNLSYSINWDYFEYDTDNENVSIVVDYPVIVGDDVPNLDKINSVVEREASVFTDYYEDVYAEYMDDNEDSYFHVESTGYVTYMSESILSIAFQEEISSNFYGAVYVYCINIDMTSGVIMENTDIIEADDDFSVDFRIRSEKQNGVSNELDEMSDQEITEYLNDEDNLIIFYTPMGMEIGINYGDGYGWITVTYHDYKEYLKVY